MVIISSREHSEDMLINITGMLKCIGNEELGRTRKVAIVYWQCQGEAMKWMDRCNKWSANELHAHKLPVHSQRLDTTSLNGR